MNPAFAIGLMIALMIAVIVVAKIFDNFVSVPKGFGTKFSTSKALCLLTILSVLVGYFLNPIGGVGLFLLSVAVLLEVRRSRSI